MLKEGQCPVDDDTLRAEFSAAFTPGSELLSWTDHQSRDLARRAESNFLFALGLSANELGFWARLVIDFTLRGDDALNPLRGLSNGEARERTLQWLRIATFYRPSLIIADGLDGFFQSDSAGMKVAGILTGIRESVSRSITLLCINEDIWKSVFENRLPSAWLDRLTGETEKLRSISPEAAEELVQHRLKRTEMHETQRSRFVDKLKKNYLWIDSETKLFPRSVIRQARELWETSAHDYLEESGESDSNEEIEPLSSITDKVAFFEALANDRPLPSTSQADPEIRHGEELFPETAKAPESAPENPFFAPPGSEKDPNLVGIDSIIKDIRGSGKTVVSETANPIDTFAPPSLPKEKELPSTYEAGLLKLRRNNGNEEHSPDTGFTLPGKEPLPLSPPPEKTADWLASLKAREAAQLKNPSLKLNLEQVESFIRNIGSRHPGLSQSEERFPSSRTVCVRWNVRGSSVLIGFESPQNVYFWNNLLQQSLSSNRKEKLAAFSHHTDRFDASLFSGFG
ncbi:MAG: hypothetical protein AAF357_19885, partial [Verrucomicrobiota bacterium]